MHRSTSGRSIEGMRLSSFLHYSQRRGNPFKRRRLKGGPPCWTTPKGKIIWLEEHQPKYRPVEYRLRTSSPEEFKKTPLVQRGVKLLDHYLPPRKPDTPLEKRKSQALQQINVQTQRYHQPFSRTTRKLRRVTVPRALQSRKETSPFPPGFRRQPLAARKAVVKAPGAKSLPNPKPRRDLRLYETAREITYGDLPERVDYFLKRVAQETPVSPEQTENRWFGLNEKGQLIMTKSSWLSRFFPNPDIQRFIELYPPALDLWIRKINQARSFYKFPPIKVSAPLKERHCHAEVLQKQLNAISLANSKDFRNRLADYFCDLSKLLYYHPDSEGQLPPTIREQVMKTNALVLDWIRCSSPREINEITTLYLSWVKSLSRDPVLTQSCPNTLGNLSSVMPTLLQGLMQGRKVQAKRNSQQSQPQAGHTAKGEEL